MQQISDFLSTPDAARVLGLKPCTLENWRVVGGGPRFRKFGKAVRYARSDLDAFAEAATRTSTSHQVAA